METNEGSEQRQPTSGTITALVAQKRNKNRVNVYLDGDFAFGLVLDEAIKLKKGQKLTVADVNRLKALDEVAKAHESALNYLSFRPRSAKEVRDNLRSKDISETAVEIVMERLERVGLVNDEEFARFWVENRDRFKPRSARAIRYELRQKGVADKDIDLALEALDAEDAAYRAALKRVRRYRKEDEQTFKRKMTAYMARLGFDYSIIRDVLERILEEKEQSEDEQY